MPAIAAGIPLLAICRGFQELNVAFGGSLHQKLHALPGRLDHRAPSGQPVDIQFAAAHKVDFTENGLLHGLLGTGSAMVNSVHWQGADRLGEGLIVEAVAPDGTVEAVRVEAATDFALAIQWHPEHRPTENPVSRAISPPSVRRSCGGKPADCRGFRMAGIEIERLIQLLAKLPGLGPPVPPGGRRSTC